MDGSWMWRVRACGMERGRPVFEAHEQFGRRVIFRAPCRHRRPCSTAAVYDGACVHIDGVALTDEQAASGFDLRRSSADACGQAWHTFVLWQQARTRLWAGCAID